ncbi:MAG TPA: WYL domain-containing protein [Longimicrobiales bacterium]
MPERVTAGDRLSRILYLLPMCARHEGATLAELAAALGISEAEVLDDVEQVTTREFYHPAGSGADLQITIEPDRIRLWSTAEFRRPVRLSPRETLALGLGLRTLAAEAEPARRTELLALAHRLEAALAAPGIETGRDADADARTPEIERFAAILAREDEDILGLVIDAARERRRCRIHYLKAGAAAPHARTIHPYHLAFAEGRWYLLAYAPERGEVRVFRIDRMVQVEVEPEGNAFTVPEDFDPARYIAGGKVYRAEDDVEVAIRYSPRIARWLAERLACERLADGSIVVRHRVADPRWAVRHVLQYGAEAEVLEPPEVRRKVREAALRMAGEAVPDPAPASSAD